jgi:hypothetical protein
VKFDVVQQNVKGFFGSAVLISCLSVGNVLKAIQANVTNVEGVDGVLNQS